MPVDCQYELLLDWLADLLVAELAEEAEVTEPAEDVAA